MCTPVTHDVLEEFLEISRLEPLEHLILEHTARSMTCLKAEQLGIQVCNVGGGLQESQQELGSKGTVAAEVQVWAGAVIIPDRHG